jgi:hypothetical protein
MSPSTVSAREEQMPPRLTTSVLALLFALAQPLAAADAWFADVTAATGIAIVPHSGMEGLGPGVAWGDYDGDGFQDLYIGMGEGLPNVLYRNNGNGTFTDVTAAAGVGDPGPSHGVYFADYDNDGDSDLYLVRGIMVMEGPQMDVIPNILYRNNGDGTFTDVTAVAGVDGTVDVSGGTSAAWADYDNDGDLDLYVVNFRRDIGEANVLYRNNGDGTFTDVTAVAGVGDAGWGLATGWGDINNDGYPDLYLANDGGDASGLNSHIFLNNGDGTFRDGTASVGLIDSYGEMDGNEMGVAFSDIDRDGWLDFYVTNGVWLDSLGNYLFHNWLYMNNGDGTVTEMAEAAGVTGVDPITGECTGWSTDIFDYNNDGEQDIYFANGNIMPPEPYYDLLYRNNGDGTFADVSQTSGTREFALNRGAAFGDFDRNGFVDILTTANMGYARLHENKANANNFLTVKVIGTTSNRDGIGARVTVTAGPYSQMEEINGGSGFLSMNDLPAEFGLAEAHRVSEVRVEWPASGIVDVATDVYANQFVTVTEGVGLTYDDPYNIVLRRISPVVVPGGELVVEATLVNNTASPLDLVASTAVRLANGALAEMIMEKDIVLAPNETKTGRFTYAVPPGAPLGETAYFVKVYGDTFDDSDELEFTVTAAE